MDLDGRNVVVTGGAGALGSSVVEVLLAAGAVCHVADRAVATPRENCHVSAGVDLTDESQVSDFYAGITGLWASVHVAGGFAMAPIAETSAADFRHQIDLNATTAFLCCRAAIAAMRAGGQGGRIVNVAARPALEPRTGAGMVAYTASKAAVAAMTQALAQEVAGEAIWVNAVVPSILDTPANRAAMPNADHAAWPTVDSVAQTVVFLASPDNAVTRGALVPVYGAS